MSDSFKTCWSCKEFYYSEGSNGYSEYTPGDPFSISCNVRDDDGRSLYYITAPDEDEFREAINRAKTCHYFKKR